jgi:phenylacetate-CoA ligase
MTAAAPRDADAQLARLVSRHWQRSGDLTDRLTQAGFSADQPPDWDGVQRVPVRAKASLAELQQRGRHLGGLVPADVSAAAWFYSPGGLVEPLVERAVERLAEQLRAAGFDANDRVLNGFAYHFTPAGVLFHDALRRLGAAVLPIGPLQVAMAAEFAARANATAFVGIASHLALLLQQIDQLPAGTIRPRLRLALAGAEPFGDEVRRRIERTWGTVCLDLYGTAESGIVALECGEHSGLHLHPDVLWEVLDPLDGTRVAPGHAGELVLTLDSDELPLLRFGTGDLVRVIAAPCACGSAAPRVVVQGRVGHSARVRGMLLHASQLRAFAERAGALSACRVTLERVDGRDVIVVTWRGAGDRALPASDALADAFRDACRLRADHFDEDRTLAAGTFELIDQRQAAASAVASAAS